MMNRNRRLATFSALGLTAALALTACAADSPEAVEPGDELTPIKLQLQWLPQGQFAGYFAAIEQGYFEEAGLDVEIIDLRTIRPLDFDTVIASVKKTNRLVVVEEGFPQSSVGDHIASQVMQRAFDHLDAPVITIAGKDVPMPYAANLEKLALPSVAEVVEAVKAVTYRD